MRLSAALKLLAVLLAALTVALVAAVKSMDMGKLKALAVEQVRAATGRELVLAGPLELRLGLVPRLIANDVSLSNMPGGSRPTMVSVERIEAEVALLPLLKREIRVQRLVLSSPDVLLETDRAGHGNWSFTAPDNVFEPLPPAKGGPPATRFTLREVKVKNARLFWRDGMAGNGRHFNLHKLMVQPEALGKGGVAVQAVGDLEGRMLNLDGRLVMPAAEDKPWGVHLQGSFDAIQAKLEGTVADPLGGRGIELAVAAQGDELGKVVLHSQAPGKPLDAQPPLALGPFKLSARLTDGHGLLAVADLDLTAGRRDALLVTARGGVADLMALTGVELTLGADSDTLAGLSRLTGSEVPSIGPLKATGQLSGGGTQWKLGDFKANLGGSGLSGQLALDMSQRPRLSGALTSVALALADFTTPASKPGEKLAPKGLKAANDGRLFPATPISFSALRSFDAKVDLHVGRLDLGKAHLTDATAQMSVVDGRLSVRPLRAALAGGTVEAEMTLAALDKGGDLALKLQGRGVDLGRMLKEAGIDALAGGRSTLRLDLRGRGESWRALMASASGESVLSVGEGRVHNTAIDWAAGDLLIQVLGVLNPLSRSEDDTPLSCAVVRFVVRDGIATADRGIAVETAKVNVVGSGTVDLRDERLDLGIVPKARDGIGLSLTSPLAGLTRVRGTLAEPSLSLDEMGTARTAASVGAAMATGGLSLLGEALFDRLTGDDTPCKTALGNAPAKSDKGKKPAGKKGRKQSQSESGFLDGLFGG